MAKVHQCGEIRCHRIIPFDQRYCSVHAKLHEHDAYRKVSRRQQLEAYKTYNREHRDQTANAFYHSAQWQRVRDYVVNRDMYASGVSGITLTDHDLIVDHIVPRRLCKDPLDTDNLWCLSSISTWPILNNAISMSCVICIMVLLILRNVGVKLNIYVVEIGLSKQD